MQDKKRQAFEVWLARVRVKSNFTFTPDDTYADLDVDWLWEAWRAGIAWHRAHARGEQGKGQVRMWKVDPAVLCNRHLLGEHVEMHMFAGTLRLGKSVQGYLDNGLVDLDCIKSRHDELASEMRGRGMNHRSPMVRNPTARTARSVNVVANLRELERRCPSCLARIGREWA